ncbi:hypothetical protein [Lichenifustis flavocetrariae]|uniref:Uncharacterized protein n=1 Tax=Lichenifustis flavocetrariae TaxID=2949735 RepID=A0AA42CLE2_9HYPH|nr:hypothetical protein [Lichenifustis flavocetrariae]MCW6511524.1 hypothetical protein [Lichenifustis flavocetrariae]
MEDAVAGRCRPGAVEDDSATVEEGDALRGGHNQADLVRDDDHCHPLGREVLYGGQNHLARDVLGPIGAGVALPLDEVGIRHADRRAEGILLHAHLGDGGRVGHHVEPLHRQTREYPFPG